MTVLPHELPPAPSPATLAEVAQDGRHLIVPHADLVGTIEEIANQPVNVSTPESAVGADVTDLLERLDEVIEAVDAPLPAVLESIERVSHSWRYFEDPYELAVSDLDEAVVQIYRDSAFPESTLANASKLTGGIVAVPLSAFDPLQSSVLPDDVDVIEGTEAPTVEYRYGHSPTSIIQTIIEQTTSADTDDTAILARGDVKRPVEAMLSARGLSHTEPVDPIPEGWYHLLSLLEATAEDADPKVGDLRSVLTALGVDLDPFGDDAPLTQIDDEAAIWLRTVTQSNAALTIDTLREQFAFRSEASLEYQYDPIDRLGVTDEVPTPANLRDIKAYLDLTANCVSRISGKIELVDPTQAWATPRRRVMLVGNVDDWLNPSPTTLDSRWTKRESYRLAQLLACGDSRIVLTSQQQPDAPLANLVTERAETESRPSSNQSIERPFSFTPEGGPRNGHDRFTKTRLNRLLTAPRDAMFAEVLDRPDRRALTRGSAIHDYADLLVGAPIDASTIGRERILDWILEQVAPLVPEHRIELMETRLWAAIAVVEAYIEDLTPHPEALEGFTSPSWMDNSLADAFDIALDRTVTEQYFRDDDLGISGVVDLIKSPTHLVDFKTGRPRSVETIVRRGRVPPTTRRPDVQLPMYLAALRRGQPEQSLSMTFVYCHGALSASLRGAPDLASLTRTIQYEPFTIHASLERRETIEELTAEVPSTHHRARLLSVLPVSAASMLTEALESDDKSEVRKELTEAGIEAGLDEDIAVAGARSAVAAAESFHRTRLFLDDLDRFESFVETCQDRRGEFEKQGYPFGDPLEHRLAFPDLHVDQSPLQGGEP